MILMELSNEAGFTNDWMGIIGEIRVPPAWEFASGVARSRWLRIQHVNRVLPLTLTVNRPDITL